VLVFIYDDNFLGDRAGGIVAGEEGLTCCKLAQWSGSVIEVEILN
jgi:hypothetical protein